MSQTLSAKRLKEFPFLIWTILLGTFLIRASFFMVWPFIAVILYEEFKMSATDIGMMLSVAAITATLIGFYVGALSDRFGRKFVLLLGCFFSIAAFSTLALAETPWAFMAGIAMNSLGRSLLEPPSKALIGDIIDDEKTRELALQGRYFMINVGGAFGPLVGVWLGLTAQQSTFFLTAAAYVLYGFALLQAFSKSRALTDKQEKTQQSFRQILWILGKDHVLLILILANILAMFVYSHIDSTLIQFLTRQNLPDLVSLISLLIFTNAATIIVFQFPVLRLLEPYSIKARIYIGMAVMAFSQLIYAFNPLHWDWGWIVATFVLSLGEVIVFPTLSIMIDRMAPNHLRGSYFGASSFYALGFASGPVLGGFMLDHFSGQFLYLTTTVVCGAVVLLYFISGYLRRPDFNAI